MGGPDRDAGRGGSECRSDSVGGPARDAGRGGSACRSGSAGGPALDAGRGGSECRNGSVGGPARDAGRVGEIRRGGSGSSFKMIGALENRTEGRGFVTGGEVSLGVDFDRGGSWLEEVESET